MQVLESVELQQWLKKIEAIHPQEIELGLERISAIARSLNCLEFSCPVVSVAGTNGKGSCVELLSAFAQAHGLNVGLYTSPHLFRFNERIRINGIMVTDELLIECFQEIEKTIDGLSNPVSLSFFEYTTLATLLVFQKTALDLIILEVGLGGRLDAVNIVDADVSVISSIGLDHESWLGNTREQVAIEKAGIARSLRPVVIGDSNPPENLKPYLASIKAKAYFRNEHFFLEESAPSKLLFRFENPVVENETVLELESNKLLLSPENILTSLQAFALLCQKTSISMNASLLEQVCYQTDLIGRFQIVELVNKTDSTSTLERVIFDLTHNPAGAAFFRHQLADLEKQQGLGKVMAVFGVMKDKDIKGILAELDDVVDLWLLCTLDSERSTQSSELEKLIKQNSPDAKVLGFSNVEQAMAWALEADHGMTSLLVFGSFFTVGPSMMLMESKGLIKSF